MCVWTCTLYRPLTSIDIRDIIFVPGKDYYATGGWKKWASTAVTTATTTKGTATTP